MALKTTIHRGFSLLEASMALALVSCAALVVITLFHSSLRYGSRVEQELLAAQAARSVLADLREWMRLPADFDNPAGYTAPGLPDYPGYTVSVRLDPQQRDSPGAAWEVAFPAQPKRMAASFLRAEVTVGLPGGRQVKLASLVGDPPRELRASNPLVLSAVPARMAPNRVERLTVQAFDADDRPLRDVFIRWSARPVNGVATLVEQSRDGSWADFKNQARLADGTVTCTGGQCRFAALLVYRGQETWVVSDPVVLEKP